jgi:hypothetical protein
MAIDDNSNGLPDAYRSNPSSSDGDTEKQSRNPSSDLILDPNGLPLVPQPSRFKDDPLVHMTPPSSLTVD